MGEVETRKGVAGLWAVRLDEALKAAEAERALEGRGRRGIGHILEASK